MKNTSLSIRIIKGVLLLASITILGSCAVGVEGSGNIIKQDRDVSAFNRLNASGSFEILIRQGDESHLTIIADDNLLESVETYVKDNTLFLRIEDYLKDYTELKAYVTVKNIETINLSGACDIESKGLIKSKDLELDFSGASDATLELQSYNLTVKATGASSLELAGNIYNLKAKLAGASNLNGRKLKSKNAVVSASGASDVALIVSNKLIISASGASTIKYAGDPELEEDLSGASTVIKIN